MKKHILFALAALSMIGQMNAANAGPARAGRPVEAVKEPVRDRDSRAKGSEGARVEVGSPEVRSLMTEVNKVTRLSPEKSRDLEAILSEPGSNDVREVVEQVVADKNPENARLNTAILNHLANLKGMDRDVNESALSAMDHEARAGKSYVQLGMKAALESKNWSPELRANLIELLELANAKKTPGVSAGKALADAAKELQATKKIAINIYDIAKLCK